MKMSRVSIPGNYSKKPLACSSNKCSLIIFCLGDLSLIYSSEMIKYDIIEDLVSFDRSQIMLGFIKLRSYAALRSP